MAVGEEVAVLVTVLVTVLVGVRVGVLVAVFVEVGAIPETVMGATRESSTLRLGEYRVAVLGIIVPLAAVT